MEDLVISEVEKIFQEREDMCKCDKCKLDVVALVLNRLPSKYVVTAKGRVYTKLQQLDIQFRSDVLRELTKAIKFVKDNPKHD